MQKSRAGPRRPGKKKPCANTAAYNKHWNQSMPMRNSSEEEENTGMMCLPIAVKDFLSKLGVSSQFAYKASDSLPLKLANRTPR